MWAVLPFNIYTVVTELPGLSEGQRRDGAFAVGEHVSHQRSGWCVAGNGHTEVVVERHPVALDDVVVESSEDDTPAVEMDRAEPDRTIAAPAVPGGGRAPDHGHFGGAAAGDAHCVECERLAQRAPEPGGQALPGAPRTPRDHDALCHGASRTAAFAHAP